MLKSERVLICEGIEATSMYHFCMYVRTLLLYMCTHAVASWVSICRRCLNMKGAQKPVSIFHLSLGELRTSNFKRGTQSIYL